MQLIAKAALAVIAVAGLLGVASPASAAAPHEIELSVDGGVTWYSDGAPALFSELGSLVPGGSQTASVQVRNTSESPAVLRIAEVIASTSTPEFVADLSFTANTATVRGARIVNVAPGACVPLLDGQRLAAGQLGTIDITVTLDEASTNGSQGGVAPIEFVVSLVEDTGGALPAVSCVGGASSGGDRPTSMPNTGSDWMTTAGIGAALAAALLGGGLFAILAGRRRRRTS